MSLPKVTVKKNPVHSDEAGVYSLMFSGQERLKLLKHNVYSDGIREDNPLKRVVDLLDEVEDLSFDALLDHQIEHLKNTGILQTLS